jgi:hypothetical protein
MKHTLLLTLMSLVKDRMMARYRKNKRPRLPARRRPKTASGQNNLWKNFEDSSRQITILVQRSRRKKTSPVHRRANT